MARGSERSFGRRLPHLVPANHKRAALGLGPLAKTAQPRLGRVLLRQRLFDRLDEMSDRLVCVVHGPPGAGKTTLTASYLAAKQQPTIWYQVDATDVDTASFFHYFSQSAASAHPKATLALPTLTAGFEKTLELFVRQYVRALCRGVPQPRIVLDNWHEISPQASLQQVIHWMCEELPEASRLFIISRGDAPQALARLRAYDKVSLIGPDDLKLTLDEAHELATSQRRVDSREVAKLHASTDGWLAGFVLSLRGNQQAGRAEATEPGSVLFDYFAEEVFRKADPVTQQALVRLSLLPRITATTACAMTGIPETAQLLERLVKESHFTTRHGAEVPVYQFHPLFRSFLSVQCSLRMTAEELHEARRLATSLLEREQDFEGAIAGYLSIADWGSAGRLLQQRASSLLEEGRHGTLLGWLKQVPESVIAIEPWLSYWLGKAALPTDQVLSHAACESAYRQFVAAGDQPGALLSWSGAASAIHNDLRGHAQLDAWIGEFDRILADRLDDVPEPVKAGVAPEFLTFLVLRQPGHAQLHEWAERVETLVTTVHAPAKRVLLLSALLFYHTWCKSQSRAGSLAQEIGELRSRETLAPFASISGYIVEVTYYQHSALKDQTVAAVRQALSLADATNVHIWDSILIGNAVMSCYGSDEVIEGDELFAEMQRRVRSGRVHDAGQFHLIEAWRAAHRKRLHPALELAGKAVDALSAAGVPFFLAHANLALALTAHWSGDAAKADKALERTLEIGATASNEKINWACLFVRSIFLFSRDEVSAAMDCLSRAFAIGSRAGFMHFFFWPTREAAVLCARALNAGIEADYAFELIRRHGLRPPIGRDYADRWPWQIKIYLMGHFEVLLDGEPLTFNGKTQKRPLMLLKALVARGGRSVKEADLADDLWPAAEGDAAHQALATTLFRLRKLLGERAVLRHDNRMTLNADICWSDVWALQAQFSQPLGDDQLPQARAITRLYAGPFLHDEEDAPWAVHLRESLRHKSITVLVDAGRALQRESRHRDAIEVFQHCLRLDDLVEELYRGLFVSYAAENRRGEAIELYGQLTARLRSRLGISPSRQTDAVYASVCGHAGKVNSSLRIT